MAALKSTINHSIPEDLTLRILSKLPIKSLKRFQCVKKSWNNLLDDPHFVRMYYENLMPKSKSSESCILLKQEIANTNQHDMFLLSGERYENKMKLDLPPPFQDNNERFQVLGSCVNGIVCLIPYEIDYNDTGNLVFWNPTTNEFKGIPLDLATVPFDDLDICYEGFGYEYYILIRMGQYFSTGEDGYLEVHNPGGLFEIYYPNGQFRRNISDYLLNEVTEIPIDFAIYLNGACHWRCVLSEGTYFVDHLDTYKKDTFFDTLFSVEVGNNKLTTTLIRQYSFGEDYVDRKLVALNKYVATISMCPNTKCIDISILGEVGVNESWVKLFIIRPVSSIESVMGIGIQGDVLLRKNDDELVSFDLGTQKIQEIGIKGSGLSQTLIYEKNFLPIERITN
ncbi:hypothetical protein PIB30_009316 [Stylosanthes scabra]|uniref:F-box domain-containing protein n=1 Tax=Stylosanthes scabra TaxID=79078 RepID=A0ABU6T6L5_9FABA|nr:hypothetical protein [Stylosanthes scabra]